MGIAGACPVPLEAGTDAGGTAIRGLVEIADATPAPLRSTDHDAASSGREGALGVRLISTCAKGIDGLAMLVQGVFALLRARSLLRPSLRVSGAGRPTSSRSYIGDGNRPLPLFTKRLEARRVSYGRRNRSEPGGDANGLTSAQLSMLIDGGRLGAHRERPVATSGGGNNCCDRYDLKHALSPMRESTRVSVNFRLMEHRSCRFAR